MEELTDVACSDGRVAPRSGLAAKNFIDTGAGVIDADYRGELKVLLFNFSDVDFEGGGSSSARISVFRCHTRLSAFFFCFGC